MIKGLSVTPRVILYEFEIRFAKSQNETERLMHLLSMRVFLIAALIDEGCGVYSEDGNTEVHGTDDSSVSYDVQWPGTIADMPKDVYVELKGRLK